MSLAHYTKIRKLAEVSLGTCFLVKRTLANHEDIECVMKQINLESLSKEEQNDAFREAKILEKLDHPNIVKFYEVFTTKKNALCIVMEYASRGDLMSLISKRKGALLPEAEVLRIAKQLILVLSYLHDMNILHRNLKPASVFLTSEGVVKLGNFGIAKQLNSPSDSTNTLVGTPCYVAPELVREEAYSFPSDVWAAGALLYELCALRPPFDVRCLTLLCRKIQNEDPSPLPDEFSPELSNLISAMLSKNASTRPRIFDVLLNPIISPEGEIDDPGRNANQVSTTTERTPKSRVMKSPLKPLTMSKSAKSLLYTPSHSPRATPMPAPLVTNHTAEAKSMEKQMSSKLQKLQGSSKRREMEVYSSYFAAVIAKCPEYSSILGKIKEKYEGWILESISKEENYS